MFCARTLNNFLNHINERALCLLHNNYNISFYDILEMSNEETVHQRDLEHLAKEIYKIVKELSPSIIINDFFSY